MIDDLEQDLKKPLADKEIASLMKTLASKNYCENTSFPKKVIQPFKPISFLELANRNIEKKNDVQTDNSDNVSVDKNFENLEIPINFPEIDNNKNDVEQIETDKTTKENLNLSENFEFIDNSVETNNSEKENIMNDPKLESNNLDDTKKNSNGIPFKEKLYTKDELDNEYQKGFNKGAEELKRKMAEEKDISISEFNNFFSKIKEKIKYDTNLLEKEIKEEIIKIVSERVGLVINETPNAFLNKIKTLSNSINKKSEKKVFKLNPEDFETVKKTLKDSDPNFNNKFVIDQSLSRGDCIIEVGGISLEDKINERYSSKEFET